MSKRKELIGTLEQLINILDVDGHPHWSKWMRTAKALLVNSDFHGVEKVLSAYGGMGSFNDVYIKVISRKTENFSLLQDKACQLAEELRKEHLSQE